MHATTKSEAAATKWHPMGAAVMIRWKKKKKKKKKKL
jgi:hypothetical protein